MGCGESTELKELKSRVSKADNEIEQLTISLNQSISAAQVAEIKTQFEKEKAELAAHHERELQNAIRTSTSGPKQRDCIRLSRSARIGTTGKYYCGQSAGDHACGPLTGSNCVECQKLDIEARELPNGFLVNGEGRICRRGKDHKTWYCGAGVLQGVPQTDGYCGPTNGLQCESCRELLSLVEGSYQVLLATNS